MRDLGLNKKWLYFVTFAEFLAGAALGIYFNWVLHYEEASYIVFATGFLLSLTTHILREEMSRTREALINQYQSAHEIISTLGQIKDIECRKKADDILLAVKKKLVMLQQGYVLLSENEFYLEGTSIAERARGVIKAVDPLTVGWSSRGSLRNYYDANLRAVIRGVRIIRIFVIDRGQLMAPDVQSVLNSHFQGNIEVRIAYREDLLVGFGDYTNWSLDFAIYDNQAVTDRGGEAGVYFGRKTSLPKEIKKYHDLFAMIDHNACATLRENGKIFPMGANAERLKAIEVTG